MSSKIKQELNKRIHKDDDDNAVVGTELKNRRMSLSRTLNGVSYKICSVSYLSKLENNKILPNQQYVMELCERLDLSSDNIETLLKSKSILISCVKAYLDGNLKKIKLSYDDSINLNNYRAMLIRLIYYLSILDITNANKIYGSIMSLISSMTDVDLLIFSLFSGILHYLNYEFLEALDDLFILKECECSMEIKLLRDKYIFLSSYALNNADTPLAYSVIKELIINSGRYTMLEDINYIMCLYYAKNGSRAGFNSIIRLLGNRKNKESASFIKDLYKPQASKDRLSDYRDGGLNAFCQLARSIKAGNEEVKSFCKELASNIYEPDNDVLILNYMALDNIDEQISFITTKAFPRLRSTREGFLIDYFFKELSYLTINMGKYKVFSDWYIKFHMTNSL